MLTNNMDATLIDDDVTIWAAQYGGSCDVEADYMFWQCSESDEVDGIEGFIDHDIWYIEPGKVYPTRAAGISDAVSVGECKVELDAESYSLKNHRAVPKVTVTYDGKKLKRGKHYSLSFVCNETEGTGYAIIRGVKTYRDWIAVPFTIE
jgi:hypothetical protein